MYIYNIYIIICNYIIHTILLIQEVIYYSTNTNKIIYLYIERYTNIRILSAVFL